MAASELPLAKEGQFVPTNKDCSSYLQLCGRLSLLCVQSYLCSSLQTAKCCRREEGTGCRGDRVQRSAEKRRGDRVSEKVAADVVHAR